MGRGECSEGLSQGDKELARLLAVLDPNGLGRVTFESLLDLLTSEQRDDDTAEQLCSSFRVLANGRPAISSEELRRELPPDAVSYCVERMPRAADGLLLDYAAFARSLYYAGETAAATG